MAATIMAVGRMLLFALLGTTHLATDRGYATAFGSREDVLTGGAGADVFTLQTASQGPDEITDFVSGVDRIFISANGFGGGLFPSDTVYGVCCDPENEEATRRLYALKGRPSARACAVMFFSP